MVILFLITNLQAMNTQSFFRIGLGTLVVLGQGALPTWAGPSVPRGAYITRPVISGQDLAKHVRTSPVVRKRYELAWGLSAQETLKRFGGIRLGKMPATTMMNVYYFRPQTNSWGYKLRRVKQGTPVFLRTDGTPVMMKICGNPIVKPAKPVAKKEAEKVPDFSPEEGTETLHTDTPPPADPAPFPEAQRSVALEEAVEPPPSTVGGASDALAPSAPGADTLSSPPSSSWLTEESSYAPSTEQPLNSSSPKEKKGGGGGFRLPFNLAFGDLGAALMPSVLGALLPASTLSDPALDSVVNNKLTAAENRTPAAYADVFAGSPLTGSNRSVTNGGSGSLSAPEPSLGLMFAVLPLAVWKPLRRKR